ncbi:MAG: hypothetical protein PVJ76_11210 [Gemmatimonadota bacterium]|jgi:hypothetical protein
MEITESGVTGRHEKGVSVSIYFYSIENDGTGERIETLTKTYEELKEARFILEFGNSAHRTSPTILPVGGRRAPGASFPRPGEGLPPLSHPPHHPM